MRFTFIKKLLPLVLAFCFLTGCSREQNSVYTEESSFTETENTEEENSSEETDSALETVLENSFSITERSLSVPGLKKDYTFLFLTDTHIIRLGGDESEQELENALPRMDLFQNSAHISSAEQFPQWITYANASNIDMVLFGGDIIDFPSVSNLSLLRDNMDILTMPYAFALGNHDWTYPWEYMTAAGRETYRPLLAEFTKDSPAASVTEYEELVILSVDNSSNQVDGEALSVTDYALSLGKPVLVLLHVPFSTETLLAQASSVWGSPVSIGMADQGGIFPDSNTLAFQEKILAQGSPVFCVLAGHVHFADEAFLNENVLQIVGDAGYKGIGTLLKIRGETE